MLAKQYSITLPADYDMGIIRRRVAERSAPYDTLEHLGLKAFLITEKGVYDSNENSYAPFYVWQSEQGMFDFLFGEKFKGLTESFGWPPVHMWAVMDLVFGNTSLQPQFATRELVRVRPHVDMHELRENELAAQQKATTWPNVHTRVVGLDPYTWTLVRFTLWDAPIEIAGDAASIQRYRVLHLSAPMLAKK